jgi:hypothetical protein
MGGGQRLNSSEDARHWIGLFQYNSSTGWNNGVWLLPRGGQKDDRLDQIGLKDLLRVRLSSDSAPHPFPPPPPPSPGIKLSLFQFLFVDGRAY